MFKSDVQSVVIHVVHLCSQSCHWSVVSALLVMWCSHKNRATLQMVDVMNLSARVTRAPKSHKSLSPSAWDQLLLSKSAITLLAPRSCFWVF